MPKINISSLPTNSGSSYPKPYDQGFEKRHTTRLGDVSGITQFGANLVRLEPGGKSSLRHWHVQQDEFLVVTDGELTLVDDNGDTLLVAGDCAAFPKNDGNGHCIENKSDADGAFVVVGTRTPTETAWYSDIDMKVAVENGEFTFTRQDGSPIEGDDK